MVIFLIMQNQLVSEEFVRFDEGRQQYRSGFQPNARSLGIFPNNNRANVVETHSARYCKMMSAARLSGEMAASRGI